jgi:riboflavin biosynthesis pyrimidine reductase
VITSTGELPLERAFFTARDFDAMVYASEAAGAERLDALRATGRPVVVVPSEAGVAWVLRHMRQELDALLLLVEGGPSLNGELFDGGLIDELFLTLGSVVVAGNGTKTAVQSERPPALDAVTRLDLVSTALNAETSEVYLRYRVGGRGAR